MKLHKVKISLNSSDGKIKKNVTGSFNDNEWNALIKFEEYAFDLAKIELHQKGGPGSLNFNYDINNGFTYSVDLPPNDQILALMHRLRPFVLNNEQTYFYKICNILSKNLEDEDFRNYLKSLKNLFSGKNFRNMAILKSNDIIINSEEMLNKWLNAYEYHRDPDKRAEIEMLHKIIPIEASRAIFVMMLYDMSRAIFIMANLVKIFMGKIKTFSQNISP